MDIIKELWYGNVAPFEQCTRGDKQMKELLSLMAEAFLQPLCDED